MLPLAPSSRSHCTIAGWMPGQPLWRLPGISPPLGRGFSPASLLTSTTPCWSPANALFCIPDRPLPGHRGDRPSSLPRHQPSAEHLLNTSTHGINRNNTVPISPIRHRRTPLTHHGVTLLINTSVAPGGRFGDPIREPVISDITDCHFILYYGNLVNFYLLQRWIILV